MSSTAESPDGGLALQSHYSLRWNNHQNHILQAFEALLHAELLVDVTLVCSESSIRAHKVVLSACSPFFERIFAEHPCKHPVIVLKDFPGREVGALVDFMYRGEVRVGRDDLPGLMRAAESLQVRGLALSQQRPVSPIDTEIETPSSDILINEPLTPDNIINNNNNNSNNNNNNEQIIDDEDEDDDEDDDDDNISETLLTNKNNNHNNSIFRIKKRIVVDDEQLSSHINNNNNNHHHHNNINFTIRDLRESCGSPLLPRRKQARPRRRSGELIPQDLSRPHPPSSLSPSISNINISPIDNNKKSQNNNYQKNLITTTTTTSSSTTTASSTLPSVTCPTNDLLNMTNKKLTVNINRNQLSPLINDTNDDVAENLSMKRSISPSLSDTNHHQQQQQQQQQQQLHHSHHHHLHHHGIKTESESASSPRGSPSTGTSQHPDNSINDLPTASLPSISALSLTPPHHHSEYLASLGQFAAHWLPNNTQNQGHHHSHHSHHHQQQQQQQQQQQRDGSPQGHNRNINNPYHSQQQQQQQQQQQESRRSIGVFSIDQMSPLSSSGTLFSHTSGIDRTSLLADIHDSFKPETLHGLFGGNIGGHHISKKSKKQRDSDSARRWSEHSRGGMPIGRPKGQHSAPRGGPPRSWTNAELTEALQHVWNKKMTTSQASRMFGIPYNSLLMYVRGKYGKSLKLEQLRRDCTGTTTNDVINNINNNLKLQQQTSLTHTIGGLTHHDDNNYSHHSLLSANLQQNFFPDFVNTNFPVPVSMVHLLPPSEQKNYDNPNCTGPPGTSDIQSRSPSPNNHDIIPQSAQSAPALLQQNGAE